MCDAVNFLLLFHKLDVICNSKSRFEFPSQLGNAAILGYIKTEVFLQCANVGWKHGLHICILLKQNKLCFL